MATVNLGAAAFVYKGNWALGGGTGGNGAYKRMHVVRHNNSIWVAIVETEEEPTSASSEWALMMENADEQAVIALFSPSISTVEVSAIMGTTAMFTANITNAHGYDLSGTAIQFQIALQSAPTVWTNKGTPLAATSTSPVSYNIEGLTIVTPYLARAVIVDSNNSNLAVTSDAEPFTTQSETKDTTTFLHIEGTGGTNVLALDGNSVPYHTNSDIVNNKVVFSANGNATTKSFEQDALENDFSAITPVEKLEPLKLTVDGTSTAVRPVLLSGYDNLITAGTKLIMDDGGTMKEVVAGTVSKSGTAPNFKYTLASTTPVLSNVPLSAYISGQSVSIYADDTNKAGAVLTPTSGSTFQTLTVKAGSTATYFVLIGNASGLIASGQHVLIQDGGVWKDVVIGTVSMTNPSGGVYEYTCSDVTPALIGTPTSAKAGSIVLVPDTAGLLSNGDTVSMNSGTGGANQNVVFGNVAGTIKTASTESASFTCNYDYVNKFHKQNIYKDTTVSDITGWTTGTSLPGVLSWSQAIVTKSRVYLLGGYNGSFVSTVYTAPINTDGTLGTWTTGTSLPGALSASQAIVTKSRVYLLGGHTGSSIVSTVYTAPFADGWQILDNNYQYISGNYTCTSPTPALVQIPTEARKGSLVIPTLSNFTLASDVLTLNYAKTPLPSGTRSVAQRCDAGIGDKITSFGESPLYYT